ncbi:MAG TPA: hypothetical protein VIL97_07105 [Thermoanaerobaculia bacterium]
MRAIRAAARRAVQRVEATVQRGRERRRLVSFHDRHRGERCFVIGNGPSLRGVDLSPLADETTFVTNHFYFHPQLAVLGPSYYCISDLWFFDSKAHADWQADLQRVPRGTTFFFPIELKRRIRSSAIGVRPDVHYLRCDRTREIWRTGAMNVDASGILATGDTVVLDFCLPLAHFMGFTEVILLGCDTDMGSGEEGAHFYETRTPSRSSTYHRDVWVDNVTRSYAAAARVFESTGRRILNATVGGRLDVFTRVSLKNVLAQPLAGESTARPRREGR